MMAMIVLAVLGLAIADAVSKRQTPVENNPLSTPNLVVNGNFTNGTSGWTIQPAGTVQNGFLCVTVPANTAANASFLKTTNNFTEVKNDVYYLNFTAYASHAVNLWLNTQGFDPSAGGAPVNPNLNTTQSPLTTSPHAFTFPYSPANQGDNTTLTISLGGSSVTTEICLANISIHRINRLPYYQDTGSAVKVNQLGYLPNGPKMATLFTQNKSAINWTLQDITGAAVDTGMSMPFGNDTASGNNAHTIDFSAFSQEGSGFVLTTGTGATSYPFSISATLYDGLRQDAMQFFYQQRSGIAIDAELAGTQYARPAGHVQVPPNTVCTVHAILLEPL
jgi:endoglucanase